MTREEILKEIEKVEDRKFYNNMVDRWSSENYRIDTECFERIRELKKMLETLDK